MLIETNAAQIASGTAIVRIETQGTTTTGVNVEILDVGKIRYMYDIYGTSNLIDAVSAIPGSWSVMVEDELSNLGSLYDSLYSEIGTWSRVESNTGQLPVANVTLYLKERGANDYQPTRFTLDWTGVQYDERNKHLKLACSPFISQQNVHTCFVQNIGTLQKMNFHYEGGTGAGGSKATAALTGDFMRAVVSNLDASATTVIDAWQTTGYANVGTQQTSQPFNLASPPDEPLDGNVMPLIVDPAELSSSYIGTDDATNFANATNVRAFDVVGALAALDGSIFGTAFGVNFWTHRNRNTTNVTLSIDEVQDIAYTVVPKTVRAVNLNLLNTPSLTYVSNGLPYIGDVSGGVSAGTIVNFRKEGFPFSDQRVDIGFGQAFPMLNKAEYNTTYGVNNFYADAGTWAGQTIAAVPNVAYLDVELINLDGAMEAYTVATGANASRIDQTRITATILGINKIRPHQSVKFDNTLPRYSGRHYRPSMIEYDLKRDQIMLTAYEIP